ncbi:MAG: TVP38/TMEM64 family protein [Pseudomonadota bacterium]
MKLFFKIFFLLLIASGSFFFFYYDLHSWFGDEEKAIRFITSFGPLSIVVFMLLQVMQVIITPIPGEVTGFIGGYLYGPVLGTCYSTIGLTIGSLAAFILARTYGLPFVERIVTPALIKKYDGFMKGKGKPLSFLIFIIPGMPKDILCYISGLSLISTKDFMLIAASGRLLGSILLSAAGSSVRNHQSGMLLVIGGACGALALSAYVYKNIFCKEVKKS